jgi:hypothetical protein
MVSRSLIPKVGEEHLLDLVGVGKGVAEVSKVAYPSPLLLFVFSISMASPPPVRSSGSSGGVAEKRRGVAAKSPENVGEWRRSRRRTSGSGRGVAGERRGVAEASPENVGEWRRQ